MVQAASLEGIQGALLRRIRVTATAAVEWIGAQPRIRPKKLNDATEKEDKSCDTPGPLLDGLPL